MFANFLGQLNINEIVSSVLGAFIGGLFTVLGVRMTIRHEKNKERRKEIKEELQEQKEREEQINKDKPRLEIVDYTSIRKYKHSKSIDACIMMCGVEGYENEPRSSFIYDKSLINQEDWVCVDYTFRNTGNTEIDHFYFSTNLPDNTAIFNVKDNQYELFYQQCLLNYDVILEKYVKPNETFTLRVCYIKDKLIRSIIKSATIVVWLIDVNGNWWEQPLFAPDNKIYLPTRSSNEAFRKETDIRYTVEKIERSYRSERENKK